MADEEHRIFSDDYFADLCTDSLRGRPTMPAPVMATVMVLQAFEGLSDREACDRLEVDLRWQAAAKCTTLTFVTGLEITVCHYPPGTSKWNKIEHRMFSFITMSWRGRRLVSYRTIVELIAATTTKKGLRIRATRDTDSYPTGVKITDAQLAAVPLTPH